MLLNLGKDIGAENRRGHIVSFCFLLCFSHFSGLFFISNLILFFRGGSQQGAGSAEPLQKGTLDSGGFHCSGDLEYVFTSSYYCHSLILSFSLVILFCRGRKRRTSAKRYFGWRRRDSIRPLKSRMFSLVYSSVDFEWFLASDCYYHSLILSFSLVVLFRRGRKPRARRPVGLGTWSHHIYLSYFLFNLSF